MVSEPLILLRCLCASSTGDRDWGTWMLAAGYGIANLRMNSPRPVHTQPPFTQDWGRKILIHMDFMKERGGRWFLFVVLHMRSGVKYFHIKTPKSIL